MVSIESLLSKTDRIAVVGLGYVGLPLAVHLSKIFDITGRLVDTLAESKTFSAGDHMMEWDGRNTNNQVVPSGVYFYMLETPEGHQTKKLTLLR